MARKRNEDAALYRLNAWRAEKETNAHGLAEFADAAITHLSRQLSQRTSLYGIFEGATVKVLDWGKVPK